MTSPAGPPRVEHSKLDRSALSGVAWSGAAKWSTQLLAWAGTIVVARILVPSDYGLLTMAAVFIGVVTMLSEFGIGTAVITLHELPDHELHQINAFSVWLGVGGTVLAVLMAYPLGLFFRAPELPPVLMVIGLTFAITSLQVVPAGLLRRDREFRTLAMIDVTRGLLMPVVTLVGALLGLRYWALVLGTVVGALVTTAMTLRFRRVPFARPRVRGLAHVLNFSRHILVGRLAYIVYQDGDFAVAGRRLGTAAVGDYSLAWTLATSPIEKVTMVLSDVTPTLFSAVQNDKPALRRYFLNLSEILCLATFPASVGLALVSHDLVAVILGAKWSGAAGPLALLALYAGARSVTSLFGHLLNATRETRFAMWTSLVLAGLLLVGFVVGSHWGTNGIAAAWLVVHPSFSVFSFTRIRRVLDLKGRDYLRALRLGLDGTFVMGVALLAFQRYVADGWAPTPRLIASILLGAVTYVVTTFVLHGARLRQILAWLQRVRRGEAAAS
jgi:O-antigen/teichoic acid export membrane protein